MSILFGVGAKFPEVDDNSRLDMVAGINSDFSVVFCALFCAGVLSASLCPVLLAVRVFALF